MKRFARKFKTFRVWRRGRKLTSYAKKVIVLHKKHPTKTLAQLTGRKAVKELSRRAWNTLTPNQKASRKLALKVLSTMRQGKSLRYSANQFGIDINTATKHLRSALTKKKGKWIAKKLDRIQRSMLISTKGAQKTIVVANSNDASLIGQYHNAVKKFLRTGDESLLKPFKGKKVKDVKGKKYELETDPQNLFDIEEAKEDSEFHEEVDRG